MAKSHLITFVLDESSSMMSRKAPTISGFNEWMAEMEKFPGEILFTMIKFNTDKHELIYKQAMLGVDEIRLNDANYRPASSTPLYDAIGRAIRETEDALSKRTDSPSVTFVILTDGEENSSVEWKLETIKQLIEEKEKDGWTFTYMGVTQDAWQGGFNLGISVGNTLNFAGDFVATSGGLSAHALATTQHLIRGGAASSNYYAGFNDADGMLVLPDEDDDESES